MSCDSTIFTQLLQEHFTLHDSKISEVQYIHGLLRYPAWSDNTDIFQFIKKKFRKMLQMKKVFFVFDASTEGFSPINEFPFFNMLYYNCSKYGVDPRQIIYVSSNFRDEDNIKQYAKSFNLTPINVFSFPSFEQVLSRDNNKLNEFVEESFNTARSNFKKIFSREKYFSSLSSVNRTYRMIGNFILCQSKIKEKGLISHDKVQIRDPQAWLTQHRLTNYSPEQVALWQQSLPMTVDRKDFNTNWALVENYRHIHDQTAFQLVNETLVDDHNRTTLFYSEKTFRPIAHFQPFIIYGQPGCNKFLSEFGYNTYESWFDLSFDDIEDPIKRFHAIVQEMERICADFENMNDDQILDWRFKNADILKKNFETMVASEYSRNKLSSFVEQLEKTYDDIKK
jgi:hypothetical protein